MEIYEYLRIELDKIYEEYKDENTLFVIIHNKLKEKIDDRYEVVKKEMTEEFENFCREKGTSIVHRDKRK